jgi:hypothetical protein
MVETHEKVVTELEKHEETMRLDDFVRIVEIHHRYDGQGVERETLDAYAEAVFFDVDTSAIDDRLTDSDEWEAGRHLYEVGDGRISDYPTKWHETMGGTDDILDIIETILDDVTEPEGRMQEAVTEERGVPEQKVYRVGKAVADIDEQEARERIQDLRNDDVIEEEASQSRNPAIRLA